MKRAGVAAIAVLAMIGCEAMMDRPRSEVIVGTWRAADSSIVELRSDGTATSNNPQFMQEVARLGATLRWTYDDATDRFTFGASAAGGFFGIQATARWEGDDRVCFQAGGQCAYWTRT